MSLPSNPSGTSEPPPTGQQSEGPHRRGKDKTTRKPRKTITREIVRLVIVQTKRDKRPSNAEIAANVGISYGALLNLLKKINEGRYDFEDQVVFIPEKKGRKPKMTREMSARARDILTSSTTATLDSARELLSEEGINVSRATIYRMTVNEDISVQMVAPRPGVVFTQQNANKRHDYALQVETIPDEALWFIDESGFNLHLAPLRCWAPVGQTPVQEVQANRGQNVSLLM